MRRNEFIGGKVLAASSGDRLHAWFCSQNFHLDGGKRFAKADIRATGAKEARAHSPRH